MRKSAMVAVGAILAVVVLGGASGCDSVTDDRTTGKQPDSMSDTTNVTVYRNADGVPNVAVFCADGLAFAATLSTDGTRSPQLLRLPERDTRCAR